MNIFGTAGKSSGIIAPWTDTLDFGKAIKNFYPSLGDATISSPTEIVTLLDGPEKVVRYGALTLSSSLTASLRCKGLTVICDSLTINSGGNLNMTARGCRVDRNDDPRSPFIDFRIPNKIGLYSSSMSRRAALDLIKAKGLAPWDRGFWDVDGGMLGLACSIAEAGGVALMLASGCGAGGPGAYTTSATAGYSGTAGTSGGTGGGGSGSSYASGGWSVSYKAGIGCPYSGGSGSGGCGENGTYTVGYVGSQYSGPGGHGGGSNSNTAYEVYPSETPTFTNGFYGGGGAGNPGGKVTQTYSSMTNGSDGTGGKLVIICYGNVTINSGGKIEANGMPAGNGGPSPGSGYPGGGGSGGGHVSIIYQGTYSNNGTVQAAGGAGGIGALAGGNGGAGSVVTKTFAQMGWN